MEAQAEAGPSTEANGSKAASQSSGQKGKVRKAYTITKQRERWTDSEHERFLQALKRYGRAWRKIEEHIGTKTAVQIRSHAQKFFSKLQREQSANGGTGDDSSKGGISIPPPRPKRKPMHPYPRKNGDTGTDNTAAQQRNEQPQQPAPSQQAAGPSSTALPALPILDNRGGEPSLNQVLEAAAVAAATAWSRVVDSAGAKVQQQLQAQLAAQQGLQGLQPLLGMNPATMYQMAAAQQQSQLAANLQSSSQHSKGRAQLLGLGPAELALAAASAPHLQAQSMQDSPDGAGAAAGPGNDRDSACSKEHNRRRSSESVDRPQAAAARQLPWQWAGQSLLQPDVRLNAPAWDMVARAAGAANVAQWQEPPQLGTSNPTLPTRAFSAGAVLHAGGTAQQAKQEVAPAAKSREKDGSRAQSRSDTSQLAHYYQQAAAEEGGAAQDPDQGENGSSGEGDGSSGDGSNGKMGLPRSDKGSNTGNSGSDEDANGNGSRSDNANDPADANGNDGKGSDEGSNSPRGYTRNSTPTCVPTKAEPQPAIRSGPVPHLFSLNSGVDQARVAAATVRLQNQQPPSSQQPTTQPRPVPAVSTGQAGLLAQQALSQQAMAAALQQQALAWATLQQQPQSYQLLQGILSNLQGAGRGGLPTAAPPGLGTELSSGERKSSGVPSMDTFAATSSRSFSVPPGVGTGAVCETGPEALNGIPSEEASGFKPYNKRHGMPVTSLPPSKRLAAGAMDGGGPHPPALNGMAQPGIYSPFGTVAERNAARKP